MKVDLSDPADIGPRDFLEAIFDTRLHPLQVALCMQHSKPGGGYVYPAAPWPLANVLEHHTHYSLSTIRPHHPEWKGFKRRIKAFGQAHLLVLDDVGEEKPRKDPKTGEQIGTYTVGTPDLVPTFKMQTKPTSAQWGFVFETPMHDRAAFEAILHACIAAGICDAGGNNAIRLARLPWSQPIGKTARAVLTHWEPDRRFDSAKLVDLLGIEPAKTRKARSGPVAAAEGATVGEDPLLQWLIEKGLVREHVDPWYRIQCPWHHAHTEPDQDDAYYLSPSQTDILRAFNCFHSSCIGQKTVHFRDWVADQGGPYVEQFAEDGAFAAGVSEQLAEQILAGLPDHILKDHL